MKLNAKIIASFLRHLKSGAFVSVAVPLAFSAFKSLSGKFTIGFNLKTVVAFGISFVVAVITVGAQLALKKRPDLLPEINMIEGDLFKGINAVAQNQLGANVAPVQTNLQQINAGVPIVSLDANGNPVTFNPNA